MPASALRAIAFDSAPTCAAECMSLVETTVAAPISDLSGVASAGSHIRISAAARADMDYRILNERTDVNACDCTRGCTDTVRESALKVDFGRKSLAAPGNRTCVSGVLVRRSTN